MNINQTYPRKMFLENFEDSASDAGSSTINYSQFYNIIQLQNELFKTIKDPKGINYFTEKRYGRVKDWDISRITSFKNLFNDQKFKRIPFYQWLRLKDMKFWNVEHIQDFESCFENCYYFNLNLSLWKLKVDDRYPIATNFNYLSNSADVKNMFKNSGFNQNIKNWDESWEKVILPSKLIDDDSKMLAYINRHSLGIFERCNFWGRYYIPDYLVNIRNKNYLHRLYRRDKEINRDCRLVSIPSDVAYNDLRRKLPDIGAFGIDMSYLRTFLQGKSNEGKLNFSKASDIYFLLNDLKLANRNGKFRMNNIKLRVIKILLGYRDNWIINCQNFINFSKTGPEAYGSNFDTFFSQMPLNKYISISYNNWDVSRVVIMRGFFNGTEVIRNLKNWDVSKVENMDNMFSNIKNITTFGIENWTPEKLKSANEMFYNSTKFNEDINKWYIFLTNLESADNMFCGATSFNQRLSNWNYHVDSSILKKLGIQNSGCYKKCYLIIPKFEIVSNCGIDDPKLTDMPGTPTPDVPDVPQQQPTSGVSGTPTLQPQQPQQQPTSAPSGTPTPNVPDGSGDEDKILGLSPTVFYIVLLIFILLLGFGGYVLYLRNTQ